jgi:hypothetical protein
LNKDNKEKTLSSSSSDEKKKTKSGISIKVSDNLKITISTINKAILSNGLTVPALDGDRTKARILSRLISQQQRFVHFLSRLINQLNRF